MTNTTGTTTPTAIPVKVENLSSRCVSEHPSFAAQAKATLARPDNESLQVPASSAHTDDASHRHDEHAEPEEGEETPSVMTEESFCLLPKASSSPEAATPPAGTCASINTTSTTTPTTTTTPSTCIPMPRRSFERRVSFTSLEIREYEVVPGSHPECSSGCPIELGWDYRRLDALSLDQYESDRLPHRRPRHALRLSMQERESLLSAHGRELGQVRRAARRHHRSQSCEGRFCQRTKQTFFSCDDTEERL